jgi:hypothetical protein
MNDEETQNYFDLESIISMYAIYQDNLRFLGYPNQIQSCIFLESELKSTHSGWYNSNFDAKDIDHYNRVIAESRSSCKEWRLLFEINLMDKQFRELSGPLQQVNTNIDGCLFLMIKQTDLDNLNFSNTVCVYQTT